jgi:hypothetical protein
MPQEQVNFNQTQRDEPTSYSIGYEEVPHYKDRDHSFEALGQKLSEQAGDKGPSWGQRLALAIVSLVLFVVMFFGIIGVATSNISPGVAEEFAPVFGFLVIGFFVAVIVINVVFNRKR